MRGPTNLGIDDAVAAAVREAARNIVPARSFREELLHDALEPALETRFGPGLVQRTRPRALAVLPDWDPQPQSIDVSVLSAAGELRLAFELKVDDVRFTLWDMLKMASAARLPSVERAYLVVAASTWESSRARQAGRRYFSRTPGPPKDVPLAELFAEFRTAWAHDLTASLARLSRFPEALELRCVASAPVTAWTGYELRAIGVRNASNAGYRPAADGWPVGAEPF